MHERLQKLVKKLDAEYGAIMEYSKRRNILFCRAEYNLPDSWKMLTNDPDENSLNGLVYSSGQSIIKNNLLFELLGHQVKSVLIVPVESDRNIIGTIEIINKNKGLFDKNDRDLAIKLAHEISVMF